MVMMLISIFNVNPGHKVVILRGFDQQCSLPEVHTCAAELCAGISGVHFAMASYTRGKAVQMTCRGTLCPAAIISLTLGAHDKLLALVLQRAPRCPRANALLVAESLSLTEAGCAAFQYSHCHP